MKTELLIGLIIFLPLIHPTLVYDDSAITLEIANTPEERAQGLMNRESLEQDRGMLFMYEEEDDRSFWMKNTTIPLDIIFLDSEMQVINIEKADPEPNTADENLERYTSEEAAKYVLEVNQNVSEEIGLEKEEKMRVGFTLSR